MFTEGLDESAINWIKRLQGSEVEEPRVRSPLSPLRDKLSPYDSFPKSPMDSRPKSPLLYNSNTFSSAHLLPPLKFHSGLLTPHSLVAPSLGEDANESVASVLDYICGKYSEKDDEEVKVGFTDEDYLEKPVVECYENEEEIFVQRPKTKLNRGFLREDLKIKVPGNFRRFTADGDFGVTELSQNQSAPARSCSVQERFQLHNAHMAHANSTNTGEFGTSSAPPMMDIGSEGQSFTFETDFEKIRKGVFSGRDSEDSNRNKGNLVDGTSQSAQEDECVERVETEEKMPYWETNEHLGL